MADEQAGRKGLGCCAKFCICYCCCFYLITALLGGAAAFLYTRFEEPSVEVTSTTINSFNVTFDGINPAGVTMQMTVVISIDNPSKKPLEATLKKVDADIDSLDQTAADGVGVPLELGVAELDASTKIKAESVTALTFIGYTTEAASSNADLAQRIFNECGSSYGASAAGDTKMRVYIRNVEVEILGISGEHDMNYDTDFVVPC
jgi:hypothetical protein